MKNAEYWTSRFLDLKKETENQTFEYMETVEKEFRKASRRIQADILVWYQRFAKNNQITLTEAKKLLNSRELEELRWTVEDYIKAGKENEVSGQWMKQLENASARVHISRLEALQIQLQQQAEILFGNQTDELDRFLQGIYTDRYYRSAFEIQKGTGIGWTFQKFDERQLKTLLSKPWAADGQNFSDRIWKNKQLLLNELQTNMIQGIIRGENPQKVAKRLAKRLDVSEERASLLVYTESSYFSEQAQRDVYKELDVEEYELLETLDSHTCEICGPLDGKVFPMSQYQPGVTAPPFHPRCRGTTVPHFDDDYGERAARDHEGNTYYVPANTTYQKWYETYIENAPENVIMKAAKENKIRGELNLSPDKIDISDYSFDDVHINKQRKHNVTKEDAQRFINQAKVSFTRWNGRYICYIGSEGSTYIDIEKKLVRTSFKRDEYDQNTLNFIKEVEKIEG